MFRIKGYTRPLYLLPFDHRASSISGLFGWKEPLNVEQVVTVANSKHVIYAGFQQAIADHIPKDRVGILVDEEFGSAILRDAVSKGYITVASVEKSGQEELEFAYGEDFAQHIEAFHPTFAKVLVRYNPEGGVALNQRQASRLTRLSDYLHQSQTLFMFELLVPASPLQLEQVEGDKSAYDLQVRPRLMLQAIKALQDAGVEPDVWKIEGLDRQVDGVKLVEMARRGGRNTVGLIVLGRGAERERVVRWLKTAASVPGFIGFAVGRTTFWQPLGLCCKKAGAMVSSASIQESRGVVFMNNQNPFKWRHFEADIILLCVRWYLRVRHVTDFSILPKAERTGRRFFGSTAYLALKDNRNKSMLVKQGLAEAL